MHETMQPLVFGRHFGFFAENTTVVMFPRGYQPVITQGQGVYDEKGL
jgi:hypothetical protein